ncbi:MAG TPA: succinate dehydrogenase/fumarate reductase iron-sulfur subunit [Thermoanaerobaculia bacterium]|jgi:succinate dehydrogenase / fumarate reductase iron-sulfur subunit|nr:succinate dehydrogenase/fumarate reductase iron-sulfur subunit [Thermoanaerobaculia bacterium]
MDLTLYIWRQAGPDQPGRMERYEAKGVNEHSSFLEMLDVLNQQLIEKGDDPVTFDHDCREGICGSCGFMINGEAHGPQSRTTVCQLHMRHFKNGDTLYLEPWRSKAFPVLKDLMVNRGAFDRIVQSGGYITVSTGSAPEANLTPIPKPLADRAFEAAECIGCGACVAQCPNGAAQLFTSAKVSHLNMLPQGKQESAQRAVSMVEAMEAQGFGACSNYAECEAVCPKGISIDFIARMNRDYIKGKSVAVVKVAQAE